MIYFRAIFSIYQSSVILGLLAKYLKSDLDKKFHLSAIEGVKITSSLTTNIFHLKLDFPCSQTNSKYHIVKYFLTWNSSRCYQRIYHIVASWWLLLLILKQIYTQIRMEISLVSLTKSLYLITDRILSVWIPIIFVLYLFLSLLH